MLWGASKACISFLKACIYEVFLFLGIQGGNKGKHTPLKRSYVAFIEPRCSLGLGSVIYLFYYIILKGCIYSTLLSRGPVTKTVTITNIKSSFKQLLPP